MLTLLEIRLFSALVSNPPETRKQMLGSLFKSKVTESVNRFKGNTDFLEGVCAAAALVAAADGEIEDSEVEATIKVISSNPTLTAAFSPRDIERTAEAMLQRAQAGRTGRMGLYKEIDDISSNHDMAETVYLTALDVSDSDGESEPQEKEVLSKIAARLKLNPKDYDV